MALAAARRDELLRLQATATAAQLTHAVYLELPAYMRRSERDRLHEVDLHAAAEAAESAVAAACDTWRVWASPEVGEG
jgi:hypothetical protein